MYHIEVLLPIGGDSLVDGAILAPATRVLAPDARRVAVRSARAEDRLPDVPLPAGARCLTQHHLSPVHLLDGRSRLPVRMAVAWLAARAHGGAAVVVALARSRSLLERRVVVICIHLAVNVDGCIRSECDRVRASDCRIVEVVRIQNLDREGLPAAGRPAERATRPALSNPTVARLDLRQKLTHDCGAVRTDIGRINGVRVVEEWDWVLDGDNQGSCATKWAGRTRPVAIQVVRVKLVYPGIPGLRW
mmetsp:Transcript_4552/g.9854  ORF Transcript_4552/g.9854 Transcript_4552/m.9854 type:complete len:247 (-) Transcript_4552:763-1503(-)